MDIRKLLFARPTGSAADLYLLLVRICFAGALFAKHGWEKLSGFQHMIDLFHMDPLHIGVYPTLAYATLSDGICTWLIIIGLATRAASLVIVVNLTVVFFVMENVLGIFPDQIPPVISPAMGMLPPPGHEHTELTFLYLCFFIFLLLTGPGRFSLDRMLFWRSQEDGSVA